MNTRDVPDSLDKARQAIDDLRDADDWDEPTGRTEVHVHLQKSDSGNPKKPNIFDIANKNKGVSLGVTGTVIVGVVIAILKALFPELIP